MIKLRIKLIRHGEKKLFLPNPGLTELGKNQAKDLANKLAFADEANQSKKVLLLSSPSQRAQETAAIIGDQLHLQVVVDKFLALDQRIKQNPQGKQVIIKHFSNYFSNYFKTVDLQNLNNLPAPQLEFGEILAITHSQNIRNYWQVLAGPSQAIVDVYECGVWTISIEGEKVDFAWTEGDLNP